MKELREQRCFHHWEREAAAKCRSCNRHYCRECVTFVGGKMVCAACLAAESQAQTERKRRFGLLAEAACGVLGFLAVWGVVAFAGKLMILIPDRFHDASIWEEIVE